MTPLSKDISAKTCDFFHFLFFHVQQFIEQVLRQGTRSKEIKKLKRKHARGTEKEALTSTHENTRCLILQQFISVAKGIFLRVSPW